MNEIILSNSSMPVIEDCGLLAASEPFYHMDRTAAFNVFIYVTDGTIYVTEEGEDYEVNPGELLFLKSGAHHWGRREIKKGTSWYFFHFHCGAESGGRFRREIMLPKKLSGLRNSRAERLIERYVDFFFSEDEMMPWLAGYKLFELLTELACRGIKKTAPESLADRLCLYLQEHYREPFSAAALEKEFFLSYKHMAAVFKRERQITMQQYHTRVRMNTACRLLKSTLMPVGEIAAEVGYRDALYFSRCFRAAQGMSPSEYRRSGVMY
ncbi:MAG: helix-turn-helix domain-containing protein [Candidatus Ornithomonoglobus sp.]